MSRPERHAEAAEVTTIGCGTPVRETVAGRPCYTPEPRPGATQAPLAGVSATNVPGAGVARHGRRGWAALRCFPWLAREPLRVLVRLVRLA